MKYKVIPTVCFPRSFKVESIKRPGSNNSWTEYFKTAEEAQIECDRRNNLIAGE